MRFVYKNYDNSGVYNFCTLVVFMFIYFLLVSTCLRAGIKAVLESKYMSVCDSINYGEIVQVQFRTKAGTPHLYCTEVKLWNIAKQLH